VIRRAAIGSAFPARWPERRELGLVKKKKKKKEEEEQAEVAAEAAG
jgi:hypothetical protein